MTDMVQVKFSWYYNPNNAYPTEYNLESGSVIEIDADYGQMLAGLSFSCNGSITLNGNGHTLNSSQGITVGNDVSVIFNNYKVTTAESISGGNIYLQNGSVLSVNGTSYNGNTEPTKIHFINSENEPGSTLNLLDGRNGNAIFDVNAQIYNLTPGDTLVIGQATTDTLDWKLEEDGSYSIYNADAKNAGYPSYDLLLSGVHLADGITPDMFEYDRNSGEIVCYLKDSMIMTKTGYVAVQDLKIGMEVFCPVKQTFEKVTWTGNAFAKVDINNPYDDFAGYPVTIKKNAFGKNKPSEDLTVTNEHCMYINEKLIPARMLVNGASIFYNKDITEFTYYHFELENHEIVMVNDVFSESYLNTGNKGVFGNFSENDIVKSWEKDSAAPLETSQTFVENIHKNLVNISQDNKMEKMFQEPCNIPFIEKDGKKIKPVKFVNGNYFFLLPEFFTSFNIVSKALRQSDIYGPFVDDRRVLVTTLKNVSRMDGKNVFCNEGEIVIENGMIKRPYTTDKGSTLLSVSI